MRSALFWDFTQRRMVVCCRRFGTTYQSHLQGTLEDGTDRFSRNVGNKVLFYAAQVSLTQWRKPEITHNMRAVSQNWMRNNVAFYNSTKVIQVHTRVLHLCTSIDSLYVCACTCGRASWCFYCRNKFLREIIDSFVKQIYWIGTPQREFESARRICHYSLQRISTSCY